MLLGRPQVLTDSEDVAVDGTQVDKGLVQLVALFAQADHQARLGVDGVAHLARHFLGLAQHAQRPRVARPLADRLLQPFDRLEVVVEYVRRGFHDHPQRRGRAVEIGDQDLDAHARACRVELADGLGKDVRAAVGQVVPRDTGYHDVLELHGGDGLGHAAWLVLVIPAGSAGLDRTEATGPR